MRTRLLLVELLMHFEVAHSVGDELIFPYLLPAPEPAPKELGESAAAEARVQLPFVSFENSDECRRCQTSFSFFTRRQLGSASWGQIWVLLCGE